LIITVEEVIMNIYDKGQKVKLQGTFTLSGVESDPNAISLSVMDPEGAITIYEYSEAELTKDDTGIYYAEIIVDKEGIYKYGMVGSGAVDTAGFDQFEVAPWPFS
jgi:hypothetical protein